MTINNKLRENVNSRIGSEVTDQDGIAIARLCRFNFTAIRRASSGFFVLAVTSCLAKASYRCHVERCRR